MNGAEAVFYLHGERVCIKKGNPPSSVPLPLRQAPALRGHREGAEPGLYTAATEAAAMERFLEFCEAWGERYPAIGRLWENAWAEFVPFLGFDVEIRKIICTTNAT